MTSASFPDRVYVESTSTGAGNLLIGSEVEGYRALTTTNTITYAIHNQGVATEYETGIGHFNGTHLVRDRVLTSSNSNNLVNFSAGTKRIAISPSGYMLQNAFTIKEPALYATTTNINLASVTTIDGHTCATNERFLLLNQTDPTKNGLYYWVTNTLVRTSDFYTGFFCPFSIVPVLNGTYANAVFLQTAGEEIDTDNLTFTQITPAMTTGVANTLAIWTTAYKLGAANGWVLTPNAANGKLATFASVPSVEPVTSTSNLSELDLDVANWFSFDMDEDSTLSLTNIDENQVFVLKVIPNGFTLTFDFTIRWAYDEEPLFTGEYSYFVFVYAGLDAYSQPIYDGFIAGEGFVIV